jgi:hypothetical protein
MRVKRSAYSKLDKVKVIVIDATKSYNPMNHIQRAIKQLLQSYYPEVKWKFFSSNDKFIWIKTKPQLDEENLIKISEFISTMHGEEFNIVVGVGDWQ